MAAALITGHAGIWLLAVLSGATGAATGFFNPASTGLLPAIIAPQRLQEAHGMRAAPRSGGGVHRPAGGGALGPGGAAGWALAVDAATFAVSALLLARLQLPGREARAEPTSFFTDLREGWGMFRSLTWVWTFVAAAALGNMCWGAWSSLGPVIAERDLGGA